MLREIEGRVHTYVGYNSIVRGKLFEERRADNSETRPQV
jgi:hypothetical protein